MLTARSAGADKLLLSCRLCTVNPQLFIGSDCLCAKVRHIAHRCLYSLAVAPEIGTDPAARKDARIIEVEIELENSAPAAGLTNLQVDVVIQP